MVPSTIFCSGNNKKEEDTMRITVNSKGKTTVFELNNSPATRDLYSQLPLTISVENYSNNEKIFYPPEKLDTTAPRWQMPGQEPLLTMRRGETS
jgi:hypothetical protein